MCGKKQGRQWNLTASRVGLGSSQDATAIGWFDAASAFIQRRFQLKSLLAWLLEAMAIRLKAIASIGWSFAFESLFQVVEAGGY